MRRKQSCANILRINNAAAVAHDASLMRPTGAASPPLACGGGSRIAKGDAGYTFTGIGVLEHALRADVADGSATAAQKFFCSFFQKRTLT
jgi:hypothetical protein